jgi:peptidoglycan biosynthesis protein MviN/MurJ (putative lipid II flippase)
MGVFAPQIIRVWFWDERFLASVTIVRVLAFGYFFNIITGVASSLAAGLGKTEFDRRYGIFASVFNLVATITLSLALGPVGIALGTSLSLVLGAIYYLSLFHGYVNVSSGEVFRLLGRPLLTGILASAVAIVLALILPAFESSRLLQAVMLAAIFLLYASVFVGILAFLHVFDSYDWQLLRSIKGKTT